jgi:hypothetical protein
VQQKTGAELWIPEHRDLTEELARGGGHMSLLTKPDGSAFDAISLNQWFADAIQDAGLPDACVLHGLRKTAARILAEARLQRPRDRLGDRPRVAEGDRRYTKGADQKRLATAAIQQLEQNRIRTASAKRTSRKVPNKDRDP